jgi:hypothetical protein
MSGKNFNVLNSFICNFIPELCVQVFYYCICLMEAQGNVG